MTELHFNELFSVFQLLLSVHVSIYPASVGYYIQYSDELSRHVSRLKTSQDTYLHVTVLTESQHIHVLSWLETRSSMSRLGSVS